MVDLHIHNEPQSLREPAASCVALYKSSYNIQENKKKCNNLFCQLRILKFYVKIIDILDTSVS